MRRRRRRRRRNSLHEILVHRPRWPGLTCYHAAGAGRSPSHRPRPFASFQAGAPAAVEPHRLEKKPKLFIIIQLLLDPTGGGTP
jgi:hypothetical protein